MKTLKELQTILRAKGVPYSKLNRDEMESFASTKPGSLGWRWKYINPVLITRDDRLSVVNMLTSPVRDLKNLRKATEQRKIDEYLKNHSVIITLTTSPKRLPKLLAVFATLDLTNVSRINVVLPKLYGHKKEKYGKIPDKITKFPKVKIIRVAKDLGPITKMLPTLTKSRDPNALVISIDDDVAYPMGMVNELIYQRVIKHPKTVISMGTAMPFRTEVKGMSKWWPQRRQKRPFADVIEGWSSVLYSPNVVDADCMKKLGSLSKQCFLSDDFVISYALAHAKTKRALINNQYAFNPHPYEYGSLEDALHAGRGLGMNKQQWEKHSDAINYDKYAKCLEAIRHYVDTVKKGKGPDPCDIRPKRRKRSKNYKRKYLKYKTKYLALKKMQE